MIKQTKYENEENVNKAVVCIEEIVSTMKQQENEILKISSYIEKIITIQEILKDTIINIVLNIDLINGKLNNIQNNNKNHKETILTLCDILENELLKSDFRRR